MITKNSDAILDESLASLKKLTDEIIIVDSRSTDNTLRIARKYRARIYVSDEEDLGKKRALGFKKAKNNWILTIDADEVIPPSLASEIKQVVESGKYDGYYLPFQCHYLGRPVCYGGESHRKLRLFKKDCVVIKPALVHEGYEMTKGRTTTLENKICHYSYRSLPQMYGKFTDYALREARQKKVKGEKTSFKKIFMYPVHMFYARFVKDKGYKDGLWRLPLDLGFAYMEWATYFFMIFLR